MHPLFSHTRKPFFSMETQQKLRSIFRSSLGSCSSRTFSDVIHKSVANPLSRPSSHSFRHTYPPDPTGPFTLGDVLKIRLRPAAAASTAATIASPDLPRRSFRHDWFSSDNEREQEEEDEEEDELETESFFSYISGSSGRSTVSRREESPEDRPRVEVKESFAVVKSSRDPYRDFRRSMVEMIVEKEMFRAEELVKLLECFLSLNSRHHHGVILDVFTEICEALIPHWSS